MDLEIQWTAQVAPTRLLKVDSLMKNKRLTAFLCNKNVTSTKKPYSILVRKEEGGERGGEVVLGKGIWDLLCIGHFQHLLTCHSTLTEGFSYNWSHKKLLLQNYAYITTIVTPQTPFTYMTTFVHDWYIHCFCHVNYYHLFLSRVSSNEQTPNPQ